MTQPGTPRRRRRDSGAAAVELALVMPLLLSIIFGTIDFGRMLNTQITLTEAAREGARASAYSQDVNARVASATNNMTGVTTTTVACSGAGSATTVTLNATFKFVTPLSVFAGMFGTAPAGSYAMTSKGVMTCSS